MKPILFGLGMICSFLAQSQSIDSLLIDKRNAILSRMTEDLGLSTTQQAKVEGVLIKRSQAISALPVEDAPRQMGLNELNATALAELNRILTMAQMELYLKLRQELENARQQNDVTSIDIELDF